MDHILLLPLHPTGCKPVSLKIHFNEPAAEFQSNQTPQKQQLVITHHLGRWCALDSWKLMVIFHFPLSWSSFTWSRQNLRRVTAASLQPKGRAIITELRGNTCRSARAKSYRNSSTEKNFKVKTGSRTKVHQVFCSCCSEAWLSRTKAFVFFLEIGSMLHGKGQKSAVCNVTVALFVFMGKYHRKSSETVNHGPAPRELMTPR